MAHRYPEAAIIRELQERVNELETLFALQLKRTLEADKLWQRAHNQHDAWPDLGKLLEWLMQEREKKYFWREKFKLMAAEAGKLQKKVEELEAKTK